MEVLEIPRWQTLTVELTLAFEVWLDPVERAFPLTAKVGAVDWQIIDYLKAKQVFGQVLFLQMDPANRAGRALLL